MIEPKLKDWDGDHEPVFRPESKKVESVYGPAVPLVEYSKRRDEGPAAEAWTSKVTTIEANPAVETANTLPLGLRV